MTSDPIPPNLRPDAFVGAAADYARYRLPYPEVLLQSLLARAALPERGARLIDLACGPGRVTFEIADRFDEVLAVDLEPEMIEAAQREAARRGIQHIRWNVGRAEDFAAPAGHFDLVTIGEAFHRVDRTVVSAKAFGWLKPGGLFVTLGVESFLHGSAPWRRILAEVVRRHVGRPAERLGGNPNPVLAEAIGEEQAALHRAGFAEVGNQSFAFPHEWSLPDLLGNLRSTSVVSPHGLGARHAAFEAELSAALLGFDAAGRYAEDINCGYNFAHKPR